MSRLPCNIDMTDATMMYARAEAMNNNLNIARQKAVIIAREQIASSISVEISNTANLYEEQFNSNGFSKEKFIFTTTSSVKQILSGSKVVCEKIDTTADGLYKVDVIVGMPKNNISGLINDRVKEYIGQKNSDVDINIPYSSIVNEQTFAIIIANENYKQEENVTYAGNDGDIVYKYFTQTLGIPENHIKFVNDASLNDMKYSLNWLSQIADAHNGDVKVLVYYAGHGIPDEMNKDAYLLPADGYGSDVSTGYKLSDLYAKLGAMPLRSAVVFMDACFSGNVRGEKMLASSRGVAIKVNPTEPKGNVVVLSASQGDEAAYPYQEAGHGMFTYYLLKKLHDTNGDVSLGELSSYITQEVKKQSIVLNGKMQTPTVSVSPAMKGTWRSLTLR